MTRATQSGTRSPRQRGTERGPMAHSRPRFPRGTTRRPSQPAMPPEPPRRTQVAHCRRLAKSFENATYLGDRMAPGGLQRVDIAPPVTRVGPPAQGRGCSVSTRPPGTERNAAEADDPAGCQVSGRGDSPLVHRDRFDELSLLQFGHRARDVCLVTAKASLSSGRVVLPTVMRVRRARAGVSDSGAGSAMGLLSTTWKSRGASCAFAEVTQCHAWGVGERASTDAHGRGRLRLLDGMVHRPVRGKTRVVQLLVGPPPTSSCLDIDRDLPCRNRPLFSSQWRGSGPRASPDPDRSLWCRRLDGRRLFPAARRRSPVCHWGHEPGRRLLPARWSQSAPQAGAPPCLGSRGRDRPWPTAPPRPLRFRRRLFVAHQVVSM